jgi:hypothetical protein
MKLVGDDYWRREEYVDALHELSSYDVGDCRSRFPSQLPVQLAPLEPVSYLRVITHSMLLLVQYNFVVRKMYTST